MNCPPKSNHPALSVLYPAGDWIRSGKKTLEIRSWSPETVPLRNLVIVQNRIKLGSAGIQEDPNGEAVALVDVESVEEWKEADFTGACATFWEPGWLAWKLVNLRPLRLKDCFPARLRIYPVTLPEMP